MSSLPEIQSLLRHDPWMRRIAGQLAGSTGMADDLVQDTWLRARGKKNPSRAWLATVLGNLWRECLRGEQRRSHREEIVARREALPSTLDLVEELSLRREVSEALLDLDEPFRRAVYMRFHREMSFQQIAEETSVGLSTAHDHVRIGLGRMRRVLDDGPHGTNWGLGLLAIAGSSLPSKTLTGVISMGMGVKVAILSIAAIGTLGWAFYGGQSKANDTGLVPPPGRTDPIQDALAGVAPLPANAANAKREELLLSQRPEAVQPVSIARLGRVVDPEGQALTQIQLAARGAQMARSNDAGEFQFVYRQEYAGSELLHAPISAHDPDFYTLVPGTPNAADESLVVAARMASFGGRVVDLNGAPVAGAELTLRVGQTLFHRLGIDRPWSELPAERNTRSRKDGSFQLKNVAGGPDLFLSVHA